MAATATAVVAADCATCHVRSQIVHIMKKAVALCGEPSNIDGQVSEYGHDPLDALEDIDMDLGVWRLERGDYRDQMSAVRYSIRDVFFAERVQLHDTPRLRPAYNLVSTELQDVFRTQHVPGVVGLIHAYLNNKPEIYEYHGCLEMINQPLIRRMFQMRQDGVVGALKSELESVKKLDQMDGPRVEYDPGRYDTISGSFRVALDGPIMKLSCYPSVARTATKYRTELDCLAFNLETSHTECGHRNN